MKTKLEDIRSHTTNDMSFTAYLIAIHGFELLSAKKLGNTYRFEVYSENGKNFEHLKLEFVGSEYARFDSTIRDLKRVVHSSVPPVE